MDVSFRASAPSQLHVAPLNRTLSRTLGIEAERRDVRYPTPRYRTTNVTRSATLPMNVASRPTRQEKIQDRDTETGARGRSHDGTWREGLRGQKKNITRSGKVDNSSVLTAWRQGTESQSPRVSVASKPVISPNAHEPPVT